LRRIFLLVDFGYEATGGSGRSLGGFAGFFLERVAADRSIERRLDGRKVCDAWGRRSFVQTRLGGGGQVHRSGAALFLASPC
jgi:hypothetical protein